MIQGRITSPVPLVVVLAMAAMGATWLVTRYVLTHAIEKLILDIPNERSSHTAPTPRGGGAAIALVVLALTAVLGVAGLVAASIAVAVIGGGLMVATVGWLDDRRSVGAGARAAVHFCAAFWVVFWIGGVPELTWSGHSVHVGVVGSLLAVLAIVWATNLYNFMDGIDGLASVEAITTGVAGAFILSLADSYGLASLAAIVAGTAAGFLVWNWMPARIFMGDVGSGFLGFVFGTLAVASERTSRVPWHVWLMLLLVFAADATATLVRRVARGDAWYAAHRRHAYQRLVQSGLSHAQVVRRVAVLNVLLAGLAVGVFVQPTLAWPMMLLGILLVAAAYIAVERRLGMWSVTQHPDRKVVSNLGRAK